MKSDLWRRVKQNQDERYHRIHSGKIEGESDLEHPALYLAFKRMFTMHTEFLYRSLATGEVKRSGVVPPIWILNSGYFSYHSG